MHEQVYQLVVEQNEITWKSMLLELIGNEKMNPWDIDISLLTQRYIERLKQLKDAELKVSGKILLAAALLLSIKSKRLVGEDLSEFDRLIAASEMTDDQFGDLLEQRDASQLPHEQIAQLIPRTPQPRKRKVSIYDLIGALEKALEVKHRRLLKLGWPEHAVVIPGRRFDVSLAIKALYKRIREHFLSSRKLLFSELVHGTDKKQKVYTFIPLLHLSNERRINMYQQQAFDEIQIKLIAQQATSHGTPTTIGER